MQPLPPEGPNLLNINSVTLNSMSLSWNDLADDEDGFRLYIRTAPDVWAFFEQIAAHPGLGTTTHTVEDLQAATTYAWRVTAYNEAGESAPSNEREGSTQSPTLPPAPDSIRATALGPTVIELRWRRFSGETSFAIQRHGASGSWADLAITPALITVYYDSTAQPDQSYFYRVGAQNQFGTSWSLDSASATTPPPGAPAAPDSLEASVILGQRVILTWADRSADEDQFELQRSTSGQGFEPLAFVPASVETYSDELGDVPEVYYYRLRAVNSFGPSVWIQIRVDFRYCSFGLLPLCLGNYWEYEVDSIGGQDITIARQVSAVGMANGVDYYLMAEWPLPGGERDSLYYLRNSDFGTAMVPYPLPVSPNPVTLYRYPGSIGQFSRVGQDCVLVVGVNSLVQVGDTSYTGCMGYQWFRPDETNTEIWIKPQSVGIVKETEYREGGTVMVAERILIRRIIQQE